MNPECRNTLFLTVAFTVQQKTKEAIYTARPSSFTVNFQRMCYMRYAVFQRETRATHFMDNYMHHMKEKYVQCN